MADKLSLLVPWLIVFGVCAGVASSFLARSWQTLGLTVLVVLLSVPVSIIMLVLSK